MPLRTHMNTHKHVHIHILIHILKPVKGTILKVKYVHWISPNLSKFALFCEVKR